MDKALHTQETLLFRLQKSMDSWDEFTQVYERYIYLIIRAMKINRHDTEDLTQDVLLRSGKIFSITNTTRSTHASELGYRESAEIASLILSAKKRLTKTKSSKIMKMLNSSLKRKLRSLLKKNARHTSAQSLQQDLDEPV